jgi:biotin synthase
MIALLRLLMPDINIAAATALEVLDPHGREKGLLSGANVIMPNITPKEQMVKYNLYDRKTLNASDVHDLERNKIVIGYGRWGDSRHFETRTTKKILPFGED